MIPAPQPAGHDADRAQQRDAHEQREHRDQQVGADLAVLERREHHVVGRPAEHPGVGDRQRHRRSRCRGWRPRRSTAPADRDPEYGEPGTRRATPRPLVRHLRPSRPRQTRGLARVFPPSDIGTAAVAIDVCSRHDRHPDTESLAKRERRELCDLALALGPDAPTLCEGWDAHDLIAHLVVREQKPIASMGNVVDALSGAERSGRWPSSRPVGFEVLVEQYRTPALFLRAVPPIDEAMNGFELLVHHEDLRRGATEWEPRELDDATSTSCGPRWPRASVSSAGGCRSDGDPARRHRRHRRRRRRATTRSP